ncbi:Regulator of chromosome condensation 1/beta-lactamase-inhibitor protein II [Pseudocohnilembus persalinus]|uniref:Regulator of chromosome condensation 1/beta-lactamase-inhibitor protein II n=1 Tax=Pseudocohnilembus persalinus TaxID=266149 RepID=A0A0V0QN30_PSEPJ|nr:Regulator of chromosome condensation 1/beta-lactamase-inhibitor protein II [Pseudocohnilembus persalinus]|eukprot:KRX03464.1 Regulator of chromosome condensation 1/beta-lactamase-inhibitor protein II [Pseudocohnilembus persalinus]
MSKNQQWLQEGQQCWVEKVSAIITQNPQTKQFSKDEKEEIFQKAKILQVTTFSIKCQLEVDQSIQDVAPKRVFQRAPPESQNDHSDLVNMEYLNDAEVLVNLKNRFLQNKFQSYIGPTLLVINPFKKFENLYSQETLRKYYKEIIQSGQNSLAYKDLEPHVYALTAECYRQLFENEKNQAIVISGESGAGKTVNTKHAMKFLTEITNFLHPDYSSVNQQNQLGLQNIQGGQPNGIEKRILSCNPVLEALGNAKTVMNDNSSRFGKYVTLIVEKKSKKIIGAKIISYLLEKSRIIKQGEGERGFHIFYHLIYGASEQFLQQYQLPKLIKNKPEYFNYLKNSKCFQVDSIDDVQLFQEFNEALKILNVPQDFLWSVVSAILQLGNIEFEELDEGNQEQGCQVKQIKTLETICSLLQIDQQNFLKAMTFKRRKIPRKDDTFSPFNRQNCEIMKDTIARDLYYQMFLYIIEILNKTLLPQVQDDFQNMSKYHSIGLLDIYGFEVNYCHQEEVVFQMEGLEDYLTTLNFQDNQEIIEILNSGVFSQLDENCKIVSNDQKLHNQLKEKFKTNKIIKFSKFSGNTNFTIMHTATDVQYDMEGFIEKNKDKVEDLILECLASSKNQYLSQIYVNILEQQEQQANSRQPKFSSTKFRKEMDNLMNELLSCDVHFIRCIKPNDQKLSETWFESMCLNQIRYSMLMDNHPSYTELENNPQADFKLLTIDIFKEHFPQFQDDMRLYGKSKVFMRQEVINQIEQVFQEKMIKIKIYVKKFISSYQRARQMRIYRCCLNCINRCKRLYKIRQYIRYFQEFKKSTTKIQLWWKKVLKEKRRKFLRDSVFLIQNLIKTQQKMNEHYIKLLAIRFIQLKWRESLQKLRKKKYNHMQSLIQNISFEVAWLFVQNKNAIIIQRYARGYITRKIYYKYVKRIKKVGRIIKENKAAVIIQENVRRFLVQQRYRRVHRAAAYIQGFFRTMWLSHIFQKLRQNLSDVYESGWVEQFQAIFKENYDKLNHLQYLSVGETHTVTVSLTGKIHTFGQNDYGQLGLYFNQNLDEYNEEQLKINGNNLLSTNQLKFQNNLFGNTDVYNTSVFTSQKSRNEFLNKKNYNQNNEIQISDNFMDYMNDKQYKIPKIYQITPNLQQNRPIQITSGKNHSLLLDATGNLYSWGSININQLGNQNQEAQNNGNNFLKINLNKVAGNQKVKFIKSEGERNFVVTEGGELFAWPWQQYGKKYQNPFQIIIPKINIQFLDCGYNFTILQATNGVLYSFGDNRYGQLGLGHTEFIEQPTPIDFLKNVGEKIVSLGCGQAHTIVASSLGKIYTFGWGQYGQLGHNNLFSELLPKQVLGIQGKFAAREKALQVVAGYRASYVLTQSRKIHFFGTNGRSQIQSNPVQIQVENISDNLASSLYEIVKINCTWSRHLSVFYCTFANTGDVFKKQQLIKQKVLNKLSQTWIRESVNNGIKKRINQILLVQFYEQQMKFYNFKNFIVDPPFIESCGNYLSEKNMKMPVKSQTNIQFESKQFYNELLKEKKEVEFQQKLLENTIYRKNQILQKQQDQISHKSKSPQFSQNYDTKSKSYIEKSRSSKSPKIQIKNQNNYVQNTKQEQIQDGFEFETFRQNYKQDQETDFDTTSFQNKQSQNEINNIIKNIDMDFTQQQQFLPNFTIVQNQDINKLSHNFMNKHKKFQNDQGLNQNNQISEKNQLQQEQEYQQQKENYMKKTNQSSKTSLLSQVSLFDPSRLVKIQEIKKRIQEIQSLSKENWTQEDFEFIQMSSNFNIEEIERQELEKQRLFESSLQIKENQKQFYNNNNDCNPQLNNNNDYKESNVFQNQYQNEQNRQNQDLHNSLIQKQNENYVYNKIHNHDQLQNQHNFQQQIIQQNSGVQNTTKSSQINDSHQYHNDYNNNIDNSNIHNINQNNNSSKEIQQQFQNQNYAKKSQTLERQQQQLKSKNSKEQYRFKLKQIKEKVQLLQQIPQSDWTENDKEFMELVNNPQIQKQINNLN